MSTHHVYRQLQNELVSFSTNIIESSRKREKIVTIDSYDKIYISTRKRIAPSAKIFIISYCILMIHNYEPKLTQSRIIHLYRNRQSHNNDHAFNNNNISESNEHSIETLAHQSPMSRIMDLMIYHPPVFVPVPQGETTNEQQSELSSTNMVDNQQFGSILPNNINDHHQQHHQHQQQTQPIVNGIIGGVNNEQTSPNNQHWTILEATNPSNFGQYQPISSYFISNTDSHQVNTGMNELKFDPAAPATLSHQATGNNNILMSSTSPILDPQSPTISQPLVDQGEQLQHIFLSSYVPEIPVHHHQQYITQSQLQPLDRPESIQQIQQMQQQSSLYQTPIIGPNQHNRLVSLKMDQMIVPQQPTLSFGGGPTTGTNQHRVTNEQPSYTSSKQESTTSDDKDSNNEESIPSTDKDKSGSNSNIDSDSDNSSSDDASGANQNDNNPENISNDPKDKTSRNSEDSSNDSNKRELHNTTVNLEHAQSKPVPNGLVSVGLNEDCLQCICRASSGCDHGLRCITRGSDKLFCGPFQLTNEYWSKGGAPGKNDNDFTDFEDCANDVECAIETVTNYMQKYRRDCDGDDSITCMDYARIHKLSPEECKDNDDEKLDSDSYWSRFVRCAESINRTRDGDDETI